MNPEEFSAAVAIAVFAGGLIGLALKHILPEKHTTGPSRDMIGAVTGLLTLLCALTASLLIWTAYGVYAAQTVAIQTVAAKVLQLDLTLQDYGPEAKPERLALRGRLGKTIDQIWASKVADKTFVADSFAAAIQNLREPEKALSHLEPSTDEQRQLLATAKATVEAIGQARLQMAFALSSPVSYPVLFTVVGWVFFLFCGFGLTSKGTVMSVAALALGAVAVGTAILMILDLSYPYGGAFRVSPAPLEQVLAVMGNE
jgi:hypothetical protein